jgi:hypothetical protein
MFRHRSQGPGKRHGIYEIIDGSAGSMMMGIRCVRWLMRVDVWVHIRDTLW